MKVIGPQIFRFEYYYLLRNGSLSPSPWYTTSKVGGMQDVAAIVADIAVIDSKSKVLLNDSQIAKFTIQVNRIISYATTLPAWVPASCAHNGRQT